MIMNTSVTGQFPPVISLCELMCALNLSNYSLSLLEKDESFPFVLIGNQRFVLYASLLEWLKVHEQPHLREEGAGA